MEHTNTNEIDIFDESVDFLTEEQEDKLLEREALLLHSRIIPEVPCECNFCGNWIDNTELFYIIGYNNDKIICLDCAEPIFEREDL